MGVVIDDFRAKKSGGRTEIKVHKMQTADSGGRLEYYFISLGVTLQRLLFFHATNLRSSQNYVLLLL